MTPPKKPAVRRRRAGAAKPLEQGIEAIRGARELIARFGAQIEPALYALLCDKKSPAREKVDKALKGGASSATAMLVPLLVAQFALAPAVAALVAAVAVQAIASAGQEKLCEELAEAKNPKSQTSNLKRRRTKAAPRSAEGKRRTTKAGGGGAKRIHKRKPG